LPLKISPPANAAISDAPIITAVATPEWLSRGLRDATSAKNANMPMTGAYSRYQAGTVRPRVNLSKRGA
jgi:hypothetical protein